MLKLFVFLLLVANFEFCVSNCICNLPLETGTCKAHMPRYGFKEGRCTEFVYGGCGGNANNFETIEECRATCPSH